VKPKDVKPKTKVGARAAVHHAPAKAPAAKLAAAKTSPAKAVAVKPAPVNQAPLKPSGNTPPVATTDTNTAAAPRPAPVPTAAGITAKKPSAAIPKENPQN
jgi:hypothetical protein